MSHTCSTCGRVANPGAYHAPEERCLCKLTEVQRTVHATAVDKGWWEGNSHNIPEKLALIHSEISEALEEYRKDPKQLDKIYFSGDETLPQKPEGFAVEIADAVIRILDLCGYLGVDLATVIRLKHLYNLTRPYRHGGKSC